jgi:mevalonate kinase
MTTVTASAPGKIILFGEHAVVYGRPALAVPIHDLQATATVRDGAPDQGLIIDAPDLNMQLSLTQQATEALALTARLVLDRLGISEPNAHLTIQSTIPVASGLGSGAAVSAALARALAEYLGHPLEAATLSALVYEVEKLHHGTPSGIDNTVVCYAQPVYFVRDATLETFHAAQPFHLLIADTGVPSPTKSTVGAVREAWRRNPSTYEAIFDEIGAVARQARVTIESGEVSELGPLMNRNQILLRKIGVSSTELERLIEASLSAGAQGAKLSGGGGGGNMIALAAPEDARQIAEALTRTGASRVLHTVVQ